jgi:hypothetical protein
MFNNIEEAASVALKTFYRRADRHPSTLKGQEAIRSVARMYKVDWTVLESVVVAAFEEKGDRT